MFLFTAAEKKKPFWVQLKQKPVNKRKRKKEKERDFVTRGQFSLVSGLCYPGISFWL
jgi:hypothetical protein